MLENGATDLFTCMFVKRYLYIHDLMSMKFFTKIQAYNN